MDQDPTAGARANARFVDFMKAEHPELEEAIPEGCQDCSSAWLAALRGRAEKLQACPGRSELKIGELAVTVCQLGKNT